MREQKQSPGDELSSRWPLRSPSALWRASPQRSRMPGSRPALLAHSRSLATTTETSRGSRLTQLQTIKPVLSHTRRPTASLLRLDGLVREVDCSQAGAHSPAKALILTTPRVWRAVAITSQSPASGTRSGLGTAMEFHGLGTAPATTPFTPSSARIRTHRSGK